ncbi:SDR family NAD(P)-dependent oxidoreductase [Streptomyces sp. NRRL F-4474]|uniref:SDR family NAD(P)-dependent oxidoreductase n=1 Tax=Streptomyces sp. NRRL F-4474 TaxID=1463851 RepID=UPI0004CC34DD|nr:SDR family NAD(P)-dependent oxidoreductase [Streptomyces sp. NRRL F-4474]
MPSSLSGRTVLVTGATSGIGYETARQLAERGATVLLHGRTPDETQAAADRLITTAGINGSSLRPFAADFAHLDEVESLAYSVVREHPRIDVLVNNAAIAAPERHTVTADGNEIAFQVNFLSHYLLTTLLEPALTSDPGGRVVNVSSSLHRTATIMWNDPQRLRRYSRLAAYAQSQLALTVFAADPRVTAVSVNPGICDTGLLPLYGNEGAPASEGARHVARLCDPATEIVNGAYYDRSEHATPAAAATDDRTVKRLNKLADLLVGHTA